MLVRTKQSSKNQNKALPWLYYFGGNMMEDDILDPDKWEMQMGLQGDNHNDLAGAIGIDPRNAYSGWAMPHKGMYYINPAAYMDKDVKAEIDNRVNKYF